jgi:hypothetical protein
MEGSFAVSGLETILLQGAGMVTTTWVLSAGEAGAVWSLASARYDFAPAAPVPEPSTLLLTAGGLAALYRRCRARQSISSATPPAGPRPSR